MLNFAEKLKDARAITGLTQQGIAEKMLIPRRTIEDWESGRRTPPPYVQRFVLNELELLRRERAEEEREKREADQEEIYLIYKDSMDDGCEIIGYCTSEAEADRYCEEYNAKVKYEYEEITYISLDKL